MSAMEITHVKLDSTLARGLDYYTGIIYEVVVPNSGLGSIIVGGRYDNLIYKTQKKQKYYIPAIGVSFGITRIALLLKQPVSSHQPIKIYIVAEDKYLANKLKIANLLVNKGFVVNYNDIPHKNIKEISYGIKNNYNFIIIYGENDDLVCIKKNDHSPNKHTTIDKLIDTIMQNI
jgi:histidyl-tRNA synthetase